MPWKQCEFIHPTGRVCGSPAMRSTSFCYHHRRRQLKPGVIKVPELTDPRSVQLALTAILQALMTGRLNHTEAGQLLYGINIAVAEQRKKEKNRAVQQRKSAGS